VLLDLWLNGDFDDLTRDDLIDLAGYFEKPNCYTVVDECNREVDEDEECECGEPEIVLESGQPEEVEPPVVVEAHHGPIKVTLTNVLDRGNRRVKMTVENMKTESELPDEYRYGEPRVVPASDGLRILYRETGQSPAGTIYLTNEMDLDLAEMYIEIIKAAADELKRINARIADDKANWEGRQTVYVI
jgi:hypothetical protein